MWKPIPKHPNHQADDETGQIRHVCVTHRVCAWNEVELAQHQDKNGYFSCTLGYVAALVLEAHVGPRPTRNHVAGHGPLGNGNNSVTNLQWRTRSENWWDTHDGTQPKIDRTPPPTQLTGEIPWE